MIALDECLFACGGAAYIIDRSCVQLQLQLSAAYKWLHQTNVCLHAAWPPILLIRAVYSFNCSWVLRISTAASANSPSAKTGKFVQPVGRPRKGHTWNTDVGIWVADKASLMTQFFSRIGSKTSEWEALILLNEKYFHKDYYLYGYRIYDSSLHGTPIWWPYGESQRLLDEKHLP